MDERDSRCLPNLRDMAVVAIVIRLGILVAALTAYSPYPLATPLLAGLGFI